MVDGLPQGNSFEGFALQGLDFLLFFFIILTLKQFILGRK